MRAAHWRAITSFAEEQDGLVSSSQLRLPGATTSEIALALADGRLTRVRYGVVAVAGIPETPYRSTRAVTLVAPHAAVSHRSAGWLHGLLREPAAKVEVTVVPPRRLRLHGVTADESPLDSADVCDAQGMRTTSPARTLVDLAGILADDWLRRLVHEAVMRRLCEYDEVEAALHRAGGDGLAGDVLRPVLADAVGESPLEARWHQILCQAGLRPPARQHQVVVGPRVFLLDFAWPDHLVGLEVDGFTAHRTRAAFDRDHDKVLALQAAGWRIVSVTARTAVNPVLSLLRSAISTGTVPVEMAGEGSAGGVASGAALK